mmetsp:Transcript_172/g.285  ORF Transcript_172/g.285 Transcript_172/m.285 type:complete len:146 (-) Transcript_172:100-537(-)|eukprot:CAMPEP_0119104524 /NCGR_PEP_ID=MMETSP1180-20130426/2722_1 /TAXON_ID=3052 ORGANISM="Chlamydomonas cf sp, Strain CCMP681" /NCGR_SAMPLE_ID=MMETSP1180 /ASSEMBLY_ACC=CAM_ASM_000741 /LENGTH=145 /DNA_ID=CAMNT_0007089315 /DNA_START=76 /DNA_END=513 /DNA_ORIENTATION=-
MPVDKAGTDAVSQNSIWREHVKKENVIIKLNEKFAIGDPRKLDILPEKPNKCVPSSNPDPASVFAATALLQNLSCLKDTDKLPHERFALPVTGNMTYGFFSTAKLQAGNPMFDYKRNECEITTFGQNYLKSKGHSPFARDVGAPK